jgi:hypothetical protein
MESGKTASCQHYQQHYDPLEETNDQGFDIDPPLEHQEFCSAVCRMDYHLSQ